jgi:hypothetical protein
MTELTLESLAERVAALERRIAELSQSDADPPGTTGDPQADDPEAVARWITAFNAIPPFQMTAAEEAAWQAARAAQKRVDAAAFDRFAAGIPGAAQ